MKENILYVDDESLNLELFSLNFSSNYNVFTAESGMEGILLLENRDLLKAIFTDMKMPGMNGIEFIKIVKEKYPMVPCYLVTGYDITPEIESALNDNLIQQYFQKPIDVLQVKAVLNLAV